MSDPEATDKPAALSSERAVPTRDESKARQEMLRNRDLQMSNFNTILETVRDTPHLYMDPLFTNLRVFVHHASSNPDLYPPSLPSSVVPGVTHASEEPTEIVALTKRFAASLYEQTDLPTGSSPTEKPMVVVCLAEKKKRKHTNGKDTYVLHHWSLTAVDGDSRAFLIKVNSGLNDRAAFFQRGAVIQLIQFAPLYVNDTEKGMTATVFLSKFEFVRAKSLGNQFKEFPTETFTVSADRIWADDPLPKPCNCRGELCSTGGIHLKQCIVQSLPPLTRNLATIAEFCPMYEEEHNGVANMPNDTKRWLLYYWYSTEFYKIRGAGNRKELPACLVEAIRKAFPALPGKGYAGFKSKSSRKRQHPEEPT